MKAVVYTDGSGTFHRDEGGVGYAGTVDGVPCEGSLGLQRATNQQAEILAAAYALDQIAVCEHVTVWSDSEYVVKGMNGWLTGWRERGWRTQAGRPVANRGYWERLLVAVDKHEAVEFRWCPGHAGVVLNERADELAGAARAQMKAEAAQLA